MLISQCCDSHWRQLKKHTSSRLSLVLALMNRCSSGKSSPDGSHLYQHWNESQVDKKQFISTFSKMFQRQYIKKTWKAMRGTEWSIGNLRAAASKSQESADKSEFMDFFIFCPEKPFGELLSNITIKLSIEFSFLRNLAKRESSCSGTTRHWILSRNYTSLTLSWRKMLYRIIMNFYTWSVGHFVNP